MIDAQDQFGSQVYIRRLAKDAKELALLQKFSTLKMRADHWNCVVPIVDSFEDPQDFSTVFIVSELLHTVAFPMWTYLDDALEFGEQMLGISQFPILLSHAKADLAAGPELLPFSWDYECVSHKLLVYCLLSVIKRWKYYQLRGSHFEH